MTVVLNRHPNGRQEVDDLNAWTRLSRSERDGKGLNDAQRKQKIRVRNRLLTSGVLKVANREALRAIARERYAAAPWWQRAFLRLRFWLSLLRARLG